MHSSNGSSLVDTPETTEVSAHPVAHAYHLRLLLLPLVSASTHRLCPLLRSCLLENVLSPCDAISSFPRDQVTFRDPPREPEPHHHIEHCSGDDLLAWHKSLLTLSFNRSNQSILELNLACNHVSTHYPILRSVTNIYVYMHIHSLT